MKETGRSRETITIEEVVYKKERIKHFNREGSEYWAEVDIPDLVEKQVEVDRIHYVCDTCNEAKTVDEPVSGEAQV
jgi:uncharacterized UBP type Zn finger protein